ncbi:MAG: tRNA (adenosine(37)-N6)-threonylcarbamoyltransferase complex ATPase subunit type 1 TsaE [Candidatus Sungbacteria bacterium]|nr:tRNA (adenosine(37)-N6)-threonylcarbamoyltransferase complex ATPase subunit type 1 TsaE [Candidatus Sungbacteria bacterium]
MAVITTKNAKETQKVASLLAGEAPRVETDHALVICLNGELGAGKTTLVQGFCRALGITERITSPTFVLMKIYQLNHRTRSMKHIAQNRSRFKHLAHIDCYRIERPDELPHLGLDEILADPDTIVLIEWANRIKKILPADVITLNLGHGKRPTERTIEIMYGTKR